MLPEFIAAEAPAIARITLFIDRDTWSYKLDALLCKADIPFVAHRTVFPHDAPDITWIAEVGKRGWVVVTRDQNIRRRPNELAAVRAAALHLFALTSGNLSAAETAAVITRAWPGMERAVVNTRPPALWSVNRAGGVRLIKK